MLHVRQVSGKYACQRFDVGYVLAQVIFRGAKLLLKLPLKADNSCFLSSKLLTTRAVNIRPLETKVAEDALEYCRLFIAEVSRIESLISAEQLLIMILVCAIGSALSFALTDSRSPLIAGKCQWHQGVKSVFQAFIERLNGQHQTVPAWVVGLTLDD
ncbi:hypothetical protein D3C75_749260 [compost metagenome]